MSGSSTPAALGRPLETATVATVATVAADHQTDTERDLSQPRLRITRADHTGASDVAEMAITVRETL